MFDTDALRLLVTVARTGSFTAAAAELNYTQSAVSRRIATLEREAGGPLLERLPRGVRLTPAGRVLHRHAEAVLDHLARAEADLAALHGGYGGTLHVGAFATANVSLLPTALRLFHETRPGVEVTPVEGPSRRLMRLVADGSLDLAIVSDYPAGLAPLDGVTLVPLLEDALHVALPPAHPLAGEPDLDLRDLREETWIQHGPPGRPTLLTDACSRAGFAPRKIIRIAEWTGKFGYVQAGLGVTLVPSLALQAVPATLSLHPLNTLTRSVHLALPATPLPAAAELKAHLVRAAERA
ncbi:LysR family transcriptional regulator [Actinocorallia aurantiaca]|uniref:LysR family transcriptional regulator n=1 Tax=Actinocorallia aurantiaca TaxID=46204 RepID=A0ABN3U821_9ACTN